MAHWAVNTSRAMQAVDCLPCQKYRPQFVSSKQQNKSRSLASQQSQLSSLNKLATWREPRDKGHVFYLSGKSSDCQLPADRWGRHKWLYLALLNVLNYEIISLACSHSLRELDWELMYLNLPNILYMLCYLHILDWSGHMGGFLLWYLPFYP